MNTSGTARPPRKAGGPIRVAWVIAVLALIQLAAVFEVRFVVHLLGLASREKLGAAQRILLVAGIFGIGYFLFQMRYACKATYGVMETLFALAFAHETSSAWQSNGGANLLALGSAVYLVVRGLSNVKDGVEERAKDLKADPKNPVIRFELALVAIWERGLNPTPSPPRPPDAGP